MNRDILNNRDKYPDNTKITLPDGTETTLGDYRELVAAEAAEKAQYQSQVADLTERYNSAAQQYNAIAQRLQQLEAQPPTKPSDAQVIDELVARLTGGKTKSVLEQPGEFFKPVVDEIQQLKAMKEEIGNQIKNLREENTRAYAWQLKRNMQNDYRQYEWPKEFSFDKAMEYAAKNSVVDPGNYNYPDFGRLNEMVAGPARREAKERELRAEAEKAGYDKAQREMAEKGAYVPNPSFGGGTPQGKAKYGSIEKIAENDILNDSEIWSQIPN